MAEEAYNEMAVDGQLSRERMAEFLIGKFMEEGPLDEMLMGASMAIPGLDEAGASSFKEDVKTALKDGTRPILDMGFDFFDKNKDGNISLEEFTLTTAALEASPEAGAEALFQIVDANNNGKVEVNEAAEFISGMLEVGGNLADVAVDLVGAFAKGPAVQMAVQTMFGVVDTDGDGMITLEEAHAVADGPLQMMSEQAGQLMGAPDEALPPQVVGVRNYIKCLQDDIVPKIKENFAGSYPVDKDTYCQKYAESMQAVMCDRDIMQTSLNMNPEFANIPEPIRELIMSTINDACTATPWRIWTELAASQVDLFGRDGVMTEEQCNTCFTLLLPVGATEKFDQVWNTIDADGDGKITQAEATEFANKAFDNVVAIAHTLIRFYQSILSKLATAVAAKVIESQGPDGITMDGVKALAEAGPERMMGIMMGGCSTE